MIKNIFVIALLFVLCTSVCVAQDMDVQQVEVDVIYLASDYLEGRETGKEGEEKAAMYLASRFDALGLSPKGTDSWMQSFDFTYSSNPHAAHGEGEKRTGTNVIGYLDNGADQTVIIGAHFDHLGYGSFGSRQPNEKSYT